VCTEHAVTGAPTHVRLRFDPKDYGDGFARKSGFTGHSHAFDHNKKAAAPIPVTQQGGFGQRRVCQSKRCRFCFKCTYTYLGLLSLLRLVLRHDCVLRARHTHSAYDWIELPRSGSPHPPSSMPLTNNSAWQGSWASCSVLEFIRSKIALQIQALAHRPNDLNGTGSAGGVVLPCACTAGTSKQPHSSH
jgi:hypothetical protein